MWTADAVRSNRLIVVDDEPAFADYVRVVAEGLGFRVNVYNNPTEFIKTEANVDATVVVLDISMPDADGIEIIQHLAQQRARPKVVLVTGFDARYREMAMQLGNAHGLDMHAAVQKPVRAVALRAILAPLFGRD